MIDLTPTIALSEVLWTLAFLVALSFNLWGLEDAHLDLMALHAAGTRNGRLIVAHQNRRNEAFRVYKTTVFLVVGILSMTAAQPILPELATSAIVSNVLFLTVAFVLALQSVLDRVERHRKLRAVSWASTAEALAVVGQETAAAAHDVADRVQGAADVLSGVAADERTREGAPDG